METYVQIYIIWSVMESEKETKVYGTRYSQAVTHPSTNRARRCLTSVIGREPVLSTWYGRRRYRAAKVAIYTTAMQFKLTVLCNNFKYSVAIHSSCHCRTDQFLQYTRPPCKNHRENLVGSLLDCHFHLAHLYKFDSIAARRHQQSEEKRAASCILTLLARNIGLPTYLYDFFSNI